MTFKQKPISGWDQRLLRRAYNEHSWLLIWEQVITVRMTLFILHHYSLSLPQYVLRHISFDMLRQTGNNTTYILRELLYDISDCLSSSDCVGPKTKDSVSDWAEDIEKGDGSAPQQVRVLEHPSGSEKKIRSSRPMHNVSLRSSLVFSTWRQF
jgi:hypothetical protein